MSFQCILSLKINGRKLKGINFFIMHGTHPYSVGQKKVRKTGKVHSCVWLPKCSFVFLSFILAYRNANAQFTLYPFTSFVGRAFLHEFTGRASIKGLHNLIKVGKLALKIQSFQWNYCFIVHFAIFKTELWSFVHNKST